MGVNGIYGLSGSGLDIESLVKMGMSGKNKQYDKMEQQEIANTWLKEAYNDVYTDMTKYKYGTLSTYKMQSNMNAMQASSSNSGVVTATANGAAAAMNHTVTVDSVASNAYLLTAQKSGGTNYGVTRNTDNKDLKNSNKLADVIFKGYTKLSESDNGIGYYNVTFADGTGTNVNGSDIAISMTLKDTADSDKEYALTYTYDDLFKDEKTLNDFASAIAKTGANIQGGYDTANDSFSFYNKTSGEKNIIGITADNGNTATLLNNLNLGKYNAATNVLSDRIDFTSNDAIATTMESTGTINNLTKSVSLKDVLGLSATSVRNDDGSYTVTVTQKNGDNVDTLGFFTKHANGSFDYGEAGNVAFSLNLSNGSSNATIDFTYEELFDLSGIGKKSNLNSNAGLDDFAAKINAAGLGITAEYDAAEDSFSLVNYTGLAELTSLGEGNNKAAADSLISSLGLVNSPDITCKTVEKTGNLGNILGITSTMTMGYSNGHTNVTMKVMQDGAQVASINNGATANYYNNTYANRKLFSFVIGDGQNSATVDVNYGDVINFAAISAKPDSYGELIRYKNQNGTTLDLEQNKPPVGVQAAQNDLSALANKINSAASSNGLTVRASYDSTSHQFTISNPYGNVELKNADGSAVKIASKFSFTDGEPSNFANKVSSTITRVNDASTDDKLSDAFGLTAVKNDGDTLTITKSDGTQEIVNASDTAFSVWVGDSTRQTKVEFSYAELFDTEGSGKLKSNFDFNDFVDKINSTASAKGVNVTASYDGDGKITLSNDGGNAYLSGDDALGTDLVSRLGFAETEESKANRAAAQAEAAGQHTFAGTNASVTIDGKTYDNDTNKLTVAGVTYNFLENTNDVVGKKVTISVSQDTDKIVDYVKSFVDEYNTLLDSLNEKLSEKKYSDYKPLSKRQEDEMTEKQIEKWNEKAKSGLLYHNSDIQSLVSAMREAIYTKVDAVDSQYNTMSSIGITTTNTKGHLTLDTDKLKKALADDPDCVYQLFASDQDSSYIAGSTNKNKITDAQKRVDYANTGIANRLDNVMTTHMKKISDIAGTSKDTDDQSYLGKLITQMQSKMQSFKTLMTSYENKLYKRYDAMEVALSRLNMQLGYISGSFS